MKQKLISIVSVLIFGGCSTLQTPQGQALLTNAEALANTAVSAAATAYGGPVAGQLASYGLDALAQVLNGYINRPVPQNIVKASPGITGVGPAVAPLIAPNKVVTVEDVAIVSKAATIAEGKK